MALRAIFLVALGLFASIRAYATDKPNLVGSRIKTEDVALRANSIFVGHFNFVGEGPDADETGLGYFDNARVKITQSLKGALWGNVTVSYSILEVPPTESNPEPKTNYVFFIHVISPTQLSVEKLLPATEDNINLAKKLIGQGSAK